MIFCADPGTNLTVPQWKLSRNFKKTVQLADKAVQFLLRARFFLVNQTDLLLYLIETI